MRLPLRAWTRTWTILGYKTQPKRLIKTRPDFRHSLLEPLEVRQLLTVVAMDDMGFVYANALLSVAAPGLLGNDTPTNTLSVTTYDHTSADGATVMVNPNGSYTYDPRSVVALEALAAGQPIYDTFSYTVSDGNGGTDTATDTVKVTGVNSLTTGLSSYWKLDDLSDSYGSNSLTTFGTVNFGAGKIGNAASFTASSPGALYAADSDSLRMGDSNGDTTTPFTLSAWVNLSSKTTGDILSKWYAWNDEREYRLYYDASADRFEFAVSSNGASFYFSFAGGMKTVAANSFGSPSIGTWYHIVAWYDGSSINIQVNGGGSTGAFDTVPFAWPLYGGDSQFVIGAEQTTIVTNPGPYATVTPSFTNYLDGKVDDVGVWQTVLSGPQRTALDNSGAGDAWPLVNFAPASPSAANDAYTANENQPLSGSSVLTNDSDVDGDPLAAALVAGPSDGSLTLNSDGTFSYTPNSGFTGNDSFTYVALDGGFASDVATVDITVAPPPVVNLSDFATSSDQWTVTYEIPTASTPLSTLNLQVYRSSDGVHADDGLLTTYTVNNPNQGSNQTATFAPDIGTDTQQDYFLVVTASGNVPVSANVVRFAGGVFKDSSNVVYVFGTPSNDTVAITQTGGERGTPNAVHVDLNGQTTNYATSSVAEIHVRTNEGADTITYSTSTEPYKNIWAFGGDGNDTINCSVGNDLLDGGSGSDTFLNVTAADIVHGDDGFDNPETVDDGETAFAETTPSAWASGSTNGFNQTSQQYSGGSASEKATWSDSVPNGYYEVFATWPPASSDATSAPFQVFDDSAPQLSTTVNQTQAPSGAVVAAHAWQSLGVVHITSGTLRVALSGDPSGTVVADAIRIAIAPPVVNSDSYTATEDVPLTVDQAHSVLTNDSDLNGLPLTATLNAPPTYGIVTFNSDGTFTYAPHLLFHGTDSFTYIASNGTVTSAPVTVTINVTAIDLAPMAVNDDYDSNGSSTISVAPSVGVMSNDMKPVGTSLTALHVSGVDQDPAYGALNFNTDGSFTYVPGPDFTGSDSFTYRVTDGTYTSPPATVTIHPPIAAVSTVAAYSSLPGAPITLYLDFAGDHENSVTLDGVGTVTNVNIPAFDLDGNPSTFNENEQEHIEQIWSAVSEKFAPWQINVTTVDPGSFPRGQATKVVIGGVEQDLVILGEDGIAAGIGAFTNPSYSNIAFVFPQITTVNSLASLISHEAGHLFGLSHQAQWEGNTLDNGYEYSDSTGWGPVMGDFGDLVSTWANGRTAGGGYQDDMATMTSASGFQYRSDDYGNTIATASPLTLNNQPLHGLLGTSTDVDFFSLSTTNGTLTVNATTNPYAPSLVLSLDLYASNGTLITSTGSGFSSVLTAHVEPGTYYVAVHGPGLYGILGQYTLSGSITDQAPVTVDDAYTTNQNQMLSGASVLANDTDADGDTLTAALVSGPAHGTLTLNPDGTFTYAPIASFHGSDSFTYCASDGSLTSDPATVSITVNAINNAPVGADNTVTTAVNTPYAFVVSDFGFSDPNDNPANNLLAVRISTLPSAGSLTNNGVAVTSGQTIAATDIAAGYLVFTPGANASGTNYASFTFQVQDDGGTSNGGLDLDPNPHTITINVTP